MKILKGEKQSYEKNLNQKNKVRTVREIEIPLETTPIVVSARMGVHLRTHYANGSNISYGLTWRVTIRDGRAQRLHLDLQLYS
jgi:hypothetical protein